MAQFCLDLRVRRVILHLVREGFDDGHVVILFNKHHGCLIDLAIERLKVM